MADYCSYILKHLTHDPPNYAKYTLSQIAVSSPFANYSPFNPPLHFRLAEAEAVAGEAKSKSQVQNTAGRLMQTGADVIGGQVPVSPSVCE